MNVADSHQNRHQSDVRNNAPWQIAVFAARESVATLVDVAQAIAAACADHAARIDILVNGNRQLAQALAKHFKGAPNSAVGGVRLCVWFIELGDKAQAWNVFVHRLYQGSGLAFFIDGYARPETNALNELALALSDDGHALAATGVPSCGRSADKLSKVMQESGGIHGNLFALTSRAMDQIRRRGFRLPLGLYRTDALIGAAVNFGFDSATNDWDPSRIRVQPSATWQFNTLRWWRLGDLKTHLKRMKRQAQGELENLAVRDHLARRRQSPETLPTTASDLVLQWWQSDQRPAWRVILRHPAWLLAIRRLREIRDWTHADLAPIVVYQNRSD